MKTTLKMKTFKTILLTLICVSFFSSSRAQENKTNPISGVVNAYFDLKNALVAGDGNKAAAGAKAFMAELGKADIRNMDAAQTTVWKNYINKLKYDSRHISETTEAEHQREHLAPLSRNLFAVVKAFKSNSSTIYEQYCPMKKVYWLSESSVIKNPYYGSKMLNCGKTVATLKAER